MSYNYEDFGGYSHEVTKATIYRPVEVTGEAFTVTMEADGTHYALTVIPVGDTGNRYIGDCTPPQVLIVGGVGRSAYCFQAQGYLDPSYLVEKLRCTECDAVNLVHMLNAVGLRKEREGTAAVKATE